MFADYIHKHYYYIDRTPQACVAKSIMLFVNLPDYHISLFSGSQFFYYEKC